MKKLTAIIFLSAALIIGLNIHGGRAADVLSDIPENPHSALVFIHGFGQDGAAMQKLAASFKDKLPDTAVFYPTAPDRAPHQGYQWFVIPAFGNDMANIKTYEQMLDDALGNVDVLHELIDDIHDDLNISYENIHVAGFSQGGLMTVLTALTNPNPLGRSVSFSGVPFIITDNFDTDLIVARPEILLIQGNNDSVIPADSLEMTKNTLESLGLAPQTVVINRMRHEVSPAAQQEMLEFIK